MNHELVIGSYNIFYFQFQRLSEDKIKSNCFSIMLKKVY